MPNMTAAGHRQIKKAPDLRGSESGACAPSGRGRGAKLTHLRDHIIALGLEKFHLERGDEPGAGKAAYQLPRFRSGRAINLI
jgi:hypothetical protein